MVFMQEFRDKRGMGHAFGRCSFKINVKYKANRQKKYALFWTTFFLSILEAGVSAFAAVTIGTIS